MDYDPPHASALQPAPAAPRVLFLATSAGDGGIERHSGLLAVCLQRGGVPLAYACHPGSFLESACAAQGVPARPLRVRNSGDLGAVWHLAALIRAFRADIVHVHSRRDLLPATLATAFLRSSRRRAGASPPQASSPRLILHAHLDKPLGQPPVWNGRLVASTAQAVVAVSQAVRHTLLSAQSLPDGLIRVIPCGVDADRFSAPDTPRARGWRRTWRAERGIPEGALAVGMVGRLSDKGQAALLAHAPLLIRKHPSLWLVFIGPDGRQGEREGLAAAARSFGLGERVVFTGRTDDMPAAIAALDVLAHFPLSEAFGLVPLEAMASGLPVVANAVGGCREVVQDGVTGLLVSPSDAQGRGAALSYLLDAHEGAARRSSMGAAARLRAATFFSLAQEVAALRSLYDELRRAGN